MKPFTMELRVRYAETDQMGIVHHSNYFVWFEAARSELCRAWGMPYPEWEKAGLFTPLAEAHCRYKAPLHYDELANVEVLVTAVDRVSCTFSYRILNGDGHLCAEGWTRHAFVDGRGRLLRNGHPMIQRLLDKRAEMQGSDEPNTPPEAAGEKAPDGKGH